MTDRDSPSTAAPLQLPPAAVLHDVRRPSHPDSEEEVQKDKHRTAKELDTLPSPKAPQFGARLSPKVAPRRTPAESPQIRSRDTSGRSSPFPRSEPGVSDITTAPDDGDEAVRRSYRLRRMVPHWYDPIVKFWKSQISLTIDEGSHRDHLANERTYLGYLRTSVALAMIGVVVAQLFRLQHTLNPNYQIGFFVLGIPLAATFIGAAIVILLLGAYRFWRQQNAMTRGKVHAGGFEISTIMILSVVLCLAIFILIVAIDIDKEYL